MINEIKKIAKISNSLLVFIASLFLLSGTAFANPANVSLSTSANSYTPGSTITVNIFINSNGSSLITARIRVSYDTSKVSLINVDESGSAFTGGGIPIDNSGGVVEINKYQIGGISGSNLYFAKINFRANNTGSAAFNVASGTQVANSGGTNIYSSGGSSGKTVSIQNPTPPPTPPSTPPSSPPSTPPTPPSTPPSSPPSTPPTPPSTPPSSPTTPGTPPSTPDNPNIGGSDNSSVDNSDNNSGGSTTNTNSNSNSNSGDSGVNPNDSESKSNDENQNFVTRIFASSDTEENSLVENLKMAAIVIGGSALIIGAGYLIYSGTKGYVRKRSLLSYNKGTSTSTVESDLHPAGKQAAGTLVTPTGQENAGTKSVDPKQTLEQIESKYGNKPK